jgi:periplasmic divalent cation tolerance protein
MTPADSAAFSFVVVLTTLPREADASRFARTLVDEGLAACVNVLPEMRSIYRWEGAVHEEPERQLVIKTSAARVEALEERIRTLHSYDVPEILVLPIVSGSRAYLSWVADSTRG